MENFGRKERVAVEEYTIEHIMPQNEDLRVEWREMLGDDWQRVHSTHLHTLGNLTLTGYNSEYSDKPFLEKRDMEGGFAHSPLKLNQGLGQLAEWNEAEIVARAAKLAALATQIWLFPQVDAAMLATLPPVIPGERSEFTMDSYPQLASGPLRALFDQLRAEVVALDGAVTEVFRSGYIAYKAETNFVDVEPQANRLKLYLNLPFHELNDPRSMARDITGVGSLGNGDAVVQLESDADLQYVVGLIRQVLNRQIGGEEQL
jgi:predicted transport protein